MTQHATIDFETYSEAGYEWNGTKWVPPEGGSSTNRGLSLVGVVNYTRHPTFEVLCAWYRLPGQQLTLWTPDMPPPADLFSYVAAGGIVEAHNHAFEHRVFQALGWPEVPLAQQRCSMAKSRAWALPASLDKAAATLGTTAKNADGKKGIQLFSVPQQPTIKQPHRRRIPQGPDFQRLIVDYCRDDVIAEEALSAVVPELSPIELEHWWVDQIVNRRGVQVDVETLYAMRLVLRDAHRVYGDRCRAITGGISPSEVSKLIAWAAGHGVSLSALDDEAITEALQREGLPEPVRDMLHCRAAVASASVKKVHALLNAQCGGRLYDLFSFHGARTGRPVGSGAQPTNFPRGSQAVFKCSCKKQHFNAKSCPFCGAPTAGKPDEWNPEAMDDAIEILSTGSLPLVEHAYGAGNALQVMAGCLRGMFIARDGYDLVSSDYTAIEAVVLACLAGEQWRIDLFKNKGKIYEASGAKVGGVTYESLLEYKAQTGKHHPLRQVGKTCLSPSTPVLTSDGWLRLIDVRADHKVWDGVEWVKHDGVTYQGEKPCVVFDGVAMTADHQVFVNGDTKYAAGVVKETKGANPYAWVRLPEDVERRPDFFDKASRAKQDVFDIVNAGPRRRFTIWTRKGPLVVSNCELALGYGGWLGGWKAFDSSGRTDEEIKQIILAWRDASPAIVEFWGGQKRRNPWKDELFGVEGAFIQAALQPGRPVHYRGFVFEAIPPAFPVRVHAPTLVPACTVQITLLSGRKLTYHNVLLEPSDREWAGKYSISYEGYNSNPKMGAPGWTRLSTYSGKLCIAGGTPVLTLDGWKPIEYITAVDSIWDGVEWVKCDGAICNGEKETIEAYGARMTHDHEVLTTEGWKHASQSARFNRADARIPDGFGVPRFGGQEEIHVESSLRVWGGKTNGCLGLCPAAEAGGYSVLRVHEEKDNRQKEHHARDELAPCVCGLALDDRPLPSADAPSMGAVWGSRDHSVRQVEGFLPELLGGHGADISERLGDRQAGQQRGLFAGELPMGHKCDSEPEQTGQRPHGTSDRDGNSRADWVSEVHGLLPTESGSVAGADARSAQRREKVYDLVNCGPRNRFVIWAGGEGLIVHNCENLCQATANDILRYAMANLERAGYATVLHVYDEIVCEVPKGWGSVEELETIMKTLPAWAAGWPIGADGGWRGKRYRKG